MVEKWMMINLHIPGESNPWILYFMPWFVLFQGLIHHLGSDRPGQRVRPLVQLQPIIDNELVNKHPTYLFLGWDSLRRVSCTLFHRPQYNA